ncbi:MAG TPA: methyltransferase domain-containing protein [Dermatophilaceae bacterium]|nr:methyltransferase domain-containing protein [Dermatophilaceae bacterium]
MPDDRVRPRRGGGAGLRTAAVRESVDAAVAAATERLGRPLRVLDLGGGTGGLAVPLAEAGHDVTVVDPSPDALASLRRRAAETGAAGRVTATQGDADGLGEILHGEPVDLVCCHGTLEHVDDPSATIGRLAAVLAPGGVLSLVVAQRLAAVLARALSGQFDAARAVLTSPDGRSGPGDPAPRRFDRAEVVALVEAGGLVVDDVHGVRHFVDLVPSVHTESEAERSALHALERDAAAHPVLAELATAVHVLASRP